jgi:hypothetical protein
VTEQVLVADEQAVLLVVGRELAHGQESVRHEQHGHNGDNPRDDLREGAAEEVVALERLGNLPHRVVADQDGRHERHVTPHEQTQQQTAGALRDVHARRPAALERAVGKTDAGDHFTALAHAFFLDALPERRSYQDRFADSEVRG